MTAAVTAAVVAPRSMAPREHGAYVQLGLPLFTVALAGAPSLAALALSVAAAATFAAHEPLVVLLGQRGSRARRELRARAWSRLLVLLLVAGSAAGLAFWLDAVSRPWLLTPLLFGAAALVVTLRQRERSLVGQLIAVAALTSVALPCAVASGLSPAKALAIVGAFYLTSLASTVEVRAVARRGESRGARLLAWAVAACGLALLALGAPLVALATLPVFAVLLGMAALRVGPSQLRRIGWALAASSVAMAIAVAVATRLG